MFTSKVTASNPAGHFQLNSAKITFERVWQLSTGTLSWWITQSLETFCKTLAIFPVSSQPWLSVLIDVDNNCGKRSRLQKPVQRCSLNPGSVDPARAAAVKDRTYLRARLTVKNTKDQITWRKSAGFSSKLNESLEKNLSIMLIKEIATQIKMISCFHARCHNSITDAKWTLIVLLFHSKIGLPVSRAAN